MAKYSGGGNNNFGLPMTKAQKEAAIAAKKARKGGAYTRRIAGRGFFDLPKASDYQHRGYFKQG
jgi:hypothetical protein